MAGIGRYKLSDALSRPQHPVGSDEVSKPEQTHETTAEETREAMEGVEASTAGASIRDRMVDIGRGNQQAGRQGS